MAEGDIETFLEDGLWCNRVAGADPLPAAYELAEAAIDAGRREAMRRGVVHIVSSPDGTVAQRYSYVTVPERLPGSPPRVPLPRRSRLTQRR